MIQGVAGRLVSAAFIRDLLSTLDGCAPPPATTAMALDRWRQEVDLRLGPASSARAIADVAVVPLLTLLELDITTRTDDPAVIRIATTWASCRGPDVLVVGWDQPLSATWRDAVTASRRADCRWALCTNGNTLRVVDAVRTWSRDYLELDLAMAGTDPQVQRLLWTFIRGPAVTPVPSVLASAADLSAEYGTDICRALGRSVLRGLSSLLSHLAACHATSQRPAGKRRRPHMTADTGPASVAAPPFEQALTVLYRVLFLLFAEARGLVPIWHPIYRDRYSMGTIVACCSRAGAAAACGRPSRPSPASRTPDAGQASSA